MKSKLLLLLSLIGFGVKAQNCVPNTSSLQFDGTSSYVSVNSNTNLDITDSITIEAWINADAWAATSAKNSIVCKHGWTFGEEGYVLRTGGTGELSFNIACDSAGMNVSWRELVSGTSALQLNHWHHVAASFNGNESKIYIDGVLAGTRTFGAPVSIIASPDYSMKIGKLADDAQVEDRFFSGKIDEVRIWHRVRSQTEIAADMSHHIDPATAVDLVGYYRLNENTGTSVADLGTGANSATIYSATWSTTVPFTEGPSQPYITIGSGYILYSSTTTGNQWNMNSSPLPGETGFSYQPTQNGTYTVTVTDSNGCSVTSAPVIITTLGIDNPGQTQKVLQSNDIHGLIRFAMSDAVLTKYSLHIFDATGKEAMFVTKGSVTKELPVDLKAGIYFITLSDESTNYKEKIMVH
jgi:hypothetical protein